MPPTPSAASTAPPPGRPPRTGRPSSGGAWRLVQPAPLEQCAAPSGSAPTLFRAHTGQRAHLAASLVRWAACHPP
ncbi:putative basic proline-rich protein-like [Iris pallida]|uniref:Basic proline-rich protein-like n=1 Tax=Iris pallida TaxID=29817 RepID=A0AAX6G4Y5_IRIPA|nr:putative basic proline-rich protein-like [Iris pallida]